MNNSALIEKFYTAFSLGNVKEMTSCYHEHVVFQDPAFGILKGERAVKMWEMLLSRKAETTKISFRNIETNGEKVTANWTAEYIYTGTHRKVINEVSALFTCKEDKIIEHIDSFSLWKWSQQALGIVGHLAGWTPYMKNKIRKTTNRQLDRFISKA